MEMKNKAQFLGLVTVIAGLASVTSHALPDPVGFCPPTATAAACSTPTGLAGETIGVGATTFGMFKTGAGTSDPTWFLLLAVPEATDGTAIAPTITSGSFTISAGVAEFDLLPAGGSIYGTLGLVGPGSMSGTNLFCDGAAYPCATSNEIAAAGSLPNDFEIFEYTVTGSFVGMTAYAFDVGGSGLTAGTYIAASGKQGCSTCKAAEFATPFTTAGLVGGKPPSDLPEPATLALFGLAFVGLGLSAWRRRSVRA
jgi:hypothetical protein